MPEYANTVRRVAAVHVENVDGKPVRILSAAGEFWRFDENGNIRMGLVEAAGEAMAIAHERPDHGKVVSLDRSLKKKQFREKNRWDLTKEQLDWIASDMWPEAFNDAPTITIAKGAAARPVALTYEAKQALSKLRDAYSTSGLRSAACQNPRSRASRSRPG
jgi:hypothetical protein